MSEKYELTERELKELDDHFDKQMGKIELLRFAIKGMSDNPNESIPVDKVDLIQQHLDDMISSICRIIDEIPGKYLRPVRKLSEEVQDHPSSAYGGVPGVCPPFPEETCPTNQDG